MEPYPNPNPDPPRSFRNQALPFPPGLIEEIRRVFAPTRARVKAAIEAQPGQKITLEQALTQVRRFSLLSGKNDEERKEILRREGLD